MYAWEGIQKSLDYIEANYSEDISMETLANAAILSPYYFQRLFGRLIKKPVNEYVKLRRLAKAAEALKEKEKRIIDIALNSGFSDHANFTRAFKNAYGITPGEYRRRPFILNQFIKPDLKLNHVTVDEDVPLITDGIVVEVTRKRLEKSRTFIGITGEVPMKELSGGKNTGIATTGRIWEEFHRQKSDLTFLLPGGNEFGVLYKGTSKEGSCTYLAGAETNGEVKVEGYTSYTLLSGDYIVCCFEAENFEQLIGSAVFRAVSFMNTWMKRHDLICGDYSAEMYYGSDPDASYMELWLPFYKMHHRVKGTVRNWDKTDGTKEPSMETIAAYVNNPLWEQLCEYVEEQYQIKPIVEFSRCSMQQGWNVKYKKAGRTLCTLYPMEGHFIALVVIGERERTETEFALPFFTDYLKLLYSETKTGMGQKWLMINVAEQEILEDVKQCIAIRRGTKRK